MDEEKMISDIRKVLLDYCITDLRSNEAARNGHKDDYTVQKNFVHNMTKTTLYGDIAGRIEVRPTGRNISTYARHGMTKPCHACWTSEKSCSEKRGEKNGH